MFPPRKVTSAEEDEEHWQRVEQAQLQRLLHPHERLHEAERLGTVVAQLREHMAQRRTVAPDGPERTPLPLADPDPLCPLCHGATYVVVKPRRGWDFELLPCQCRMEREAQEHRQRLWKNSNLAGREHLTFETFPRSASTQAAYEQAVAYAENPLGEHPWFLIVGPPHSGKTHLAVAIAHEVYAQKRTVLIVTWAALCEWAAEIYRADAPLPAIEQLELVRSVYLLVVDDVGEVKPTPLALEKLYQLINFRYNYNLATVYTTVDIDQYTIDLRLRSRLVDWQLTRAVLLLPPPRPIVSRSRPF